MSVSQRQVRVECARFRSGNAERFLSKSSIFEAGMLINPVHLPRADYLREQLLFALSAHDYGFGVAPAVTCTGLSVSGVDELTVGAGLSAGISVPAG